MKKGSHEYIQILQYLYETDDHASSPTKLFYLESNCVECKYVINREYVIHADHCVTNKKDLAQESSNDLCYLPPQPKVHERFSQVSMIPISQPSMRSDIHTHVQCENPAKKKNMFPHCNQTPTLISLFRL